uniref:Group II intron maturase-specific domain-containing protein n=1 Tax=Codium arabicum TaxID=221038 RepID=A0A386B0J4_CODAR|nr:hypothetical protein [Codium arabicum]AYC65209.1 hypothetical protein [Codium arabicum]
MSFQFFEPFWALLQFSYFFNFQQNKQFLFFKFKAAFLFRRFFKQWFLFFSLFSSSLFSSPLFSKWALFQRNFLLQHFQFLFFDFFFFQLISLFNLSFFFFFQSSLFVCFCSFFYEVLIFVYFFDFFFFSSSLQVFSSFEALTFSYWVFKQSFLPFTKSFLILPNKSFLSFLLSILKNEWSFLHGKTTLAVILRFNPIIRKWALFFLHANFDFSFFSNLDQWMFFKSWRFAQRENVNKSKNWIKSKYFGSFLSFQHDQWIFGDKQTGYFLLKFKWFF